MFESRHGYGIRCGSAASQHGRFDFPSPSSGFFFRVGSGSLSLSRCPLEHSRESGDTFWVPVLSALRRERSEGAQSRELTKMSRIHSLAAKSVLPYGLLCDLSACVRPPFCFHTSECSTEVAVEVLHDSSDLTGGCRTPGCFVLGIFRGLHFVC